LTIIDKPNNRNLNYFGQKVRELREKKGLLLRQVAAHLEVDTALMSKIETGDRNASKEQIEKIAEILEANKAELQKLWLSDKIYATMDELPQAAEEAVKYVLRNYRKK
jgi:transcriptional regulator with XRE-family HTH domain